MSIANTGIKRRPMHPGEMLRARLFDNSAEFWLNAQRAVDLWEAGKSDTERCASDTPAQCRLNRRCS
jgi:plasmid maintenance system antidote protein VapI